MLLEVSGLNKKYGNSEILKDVRLEIDRGEIFTVIGPTGSGKTTLLRLIALLDRPTDGTISFDGLDVTRSESSRFRIRRRTAIVFQKPAVFNTSVYNNVAYGLKIRGVNKEHIREKVMNALEAVGLSGYENRDARTLSGGETQRVALARAMVIEPELLLLDEPTANLDPNSTAIIERLISKLIEKPDTTVIMSTHDMFQGKRLSNRMGVLIDGQLLQTGLPADLFNLPRSRKIAEFVGMENILDGVVTSNEEGMITINVGDLVVEGISGLSPGEKVCACIRPEEITLTRSKESTSARNNFPAKVSRISSFGPLARVEMDCGFPLVALITRRSAEEMELTVDTPINASFKATGVHILPG